MAELQLRGGEVDGLALHYVVEGRGPAVILLHGLGGFAESWRHNIAPLAARATVYAIDLPGFGRSAKPRTLYRLSYFARAVHGFMEAMGIPQASLVGHSLGGAVAVTYALTHPTRVERLALLAAIAQCFHAPARAEVDFLVDHDYAQRTGPEARAAWLATVRHIRTDFIDHRADYRRAIATLDLPVLLVHGRQDRAVLPAHGAEAAEGLPRAALRWVDACGHFPQIEHAAVVNAWLTDFLVGRHAQR
jgi:pyruvate dehydrogenase E2 component (dihydrolipoamide acetyltransferase)